MCDRFMCNIIFVSPLPVRLLSMAVGADKCLMEVRSFKQKKRSDLCLLPSLHHSAPACQTEIVAFGTQLCSLCLSVEGV